MLTLSSGAILFTPATMKYFRDRMTAAASYSRMRISDEIVIFAAIFISALPYLGTIGFYSDDWAFLHAYDSARSGGLAEVFRTALRIPVAERPLHGLYISSLFLLFGTNPLPQHLVNTGLLALSGTLIFKTLRDLNVPKGEAFATAILFGFLPQLTTLRVWYATFQIVLSLVLFLVSVRLELRFARSGAISAKLLALIFAGCSLAAYETTAPLLAVVALGAGWLRSRRQPGWTQAFLVQLPNLILIAAVLAAKWIITKRVSEGTGIANQLHMIFWTFWSSSYDWRFDGGLNLWAALSVNFWHAIVDEVHSIFRVWAISHAPAIVLINLLLGVLTFLRLKDVPATRPVSWRPGAFIGMGFAIFWLGYAVFLVNNMVHFSPSSTGNRTATPASIGVAMVLVGAAKLCTDRLGGWFHRRFFALFIAALVIIGGVHANVVASRWAAAWSRQSAILNYAKSDLSALPANATVILDASCPYDGPAIIFESPWDWMSAASMTLGTEIVGDVAIPSLRYGSAGLSTQIYDMKNEYAYGDNLYIYRPDDHRVVRINTIGAAQSYWREHQSAVRSCPVGRPSMGVIEW